MSTKDIPEAKLRAVARYLDGFPPPTQGQNEEDIEQYYCLLMVELSRLGPKFTYTRSQVLTYACTLCNSPTNGWVNLCFCILVLYLCIQISFLLVSLLVRGIRTGLLMEVLQLHQLGLVSFYYKNFHKFYTHFLACAQACHSEFVCMNIHCSIAQVTLSHSNGVALRSYMITKPEQ